MKTTFALNKKTVELPADTHTPVGVYLKLRDIFPGALLLECTDYSSQQNAFSHICLNPILGIEATSEGIVTYLPNGKKEQLPLENLTEQTNEFLESLTINNDSESGVATGLFGFTSFDAALLFDRYPQHLVEKAKANREMPFMKYDLYKTVITFNHFSDTLYITEFYNNELPISMTDKLANILANRNFGSYPFSLIGKEQQPIANEEYKAMVTKSKAHCQRGDVFQIVPSMPFKQAFSGDEFNVYRALRSVNPSPYLFYFDFIGYKIFGSSPEAQLKVSNNKATINPIAGTVRRTGNATADLALASELLADPKENSEHVMLVDLARNDLGKYGKNVKVETYKEVQTFSHVMHLVSTVTCELPSNEQPFSLFASTFPAGTLSGAPKHKAIELIAEMEPTSRGFYGGAIGYIGLDGTLNQAITIRSFFSKQGMLTYQAGAGIVIDSNEDGELQEVNNKVNALRTALGKANNYANH